MTEEAEAIHSHLESEMRYAGLLSGNDPDADVIVLSLRSLAAGGPSASDKAIELFERIAEFKPLSPLLGTDDEWIRIPEAPVNFWQNRRCFTVFKTDERTYDVDAGPLYRLPNGDIAVDPTDIVDITFPYMPGAAERQVIDVLDAIAANVIV